MSLADYLPVTRGYLERRLENMATVQDLESAINAERQQVLAAVTEMRNEIQRLKDQIGQGTVVMPEDLDRLKNMVDGIYQGE